MRFVFVCIVGFLLAACDSTPVPSIVKIHGPTMGTHYNISWVGENAKAISIQSLVDERLLNINRSMSTYDPTSEISLLNQGHIAADSDGWIPLSHDFADVMNISLDVWQKSGGAFDVTIGPLVNMWGFGPQARPTITPDAVFINDIKASVGSQFIEFRANPPAVRLSKALYVDMSAVAKGWAVDEIGALLEEQGIYAYMVEIGGEIRTRGVKPDNTLWRIAIERPQTQNGDRVALVIEPGDRGLATSGNYRNYYEDKGVRYSHTIDPTTGYPIRHQLASVTVVHESTGYADAWATAITVLGPEKGLQLAEQYQLAVFMLVGDGDVFNEVISSKFLALFPQVAE